MSCDYIYKGKRYSRVGLLNVLSQNPAAISNTARQFLRDKLGMSDNQIEIVDGLIDNKSLGRFKDDGDILLSSFANDSVLYHEAFHRVFRMFLKPDERNYYYNEFRKRNNYKGLIDKYKTLYPENNEEENIEEFLADEFADYMLNNQTLNIDMKTKSLFERIIDFVKKLLGINNKTIYDLYKDINRGKFNTKSLDAKYRYNKSADKVEINGNNYSYDVKNEFIQSVTREFINEVLSQDTVYDFIKNKIDPGLYSQLYKQSLIRVAESLIDYYPDMVNDFLIDYEKGPESYLNNQFKSYMETLIGKVDFTFVEEAEKELSEQGEGEDTAGRQQDDTSRVWTASIEIDPKTTMSKAIKLLLASFEDQNSVNSLGLYSQVRWSNAFNKIARHLAGIPTAKSIEHLSKLNESWVPSLVEMLGGVNPDGRSLSLAHIRLRNDFIKTFSKNENTFMLAEINDEGIKIFDANQNTQEKKKLKEWNDSMFLAIKRSNDTGSFEHWLKRVKIELVDAKNPTDTNYVELLGIDVEDELKNQVLFTQNGQDMYYMSTMKAIANYILKSAEKNEFTDENQPDWKNLFNDKNFDIEGTLKNLAKAQNEFEDVVDLMIYNRGKKLYGISLNTHTTHTINTLNYIAGLIDPNMSINEKLNIINEFLPDILNYQTIDKVNGEFVIKSKWLNHILMGNKINMVIVDGVKNKLGDDEALSDIDEPDLYSATLNMSLRNLNIAFKHSDRSTFFGYQLQNGSIFDYQNGYSTPDSIVNYLTTVLQDQLATEKRRSNLKDLPLFQYFSKTYQDSQLFGLKNINQIDPYSKDIEKFIRDLIQKELNSYKDNLIKWKVITPGSKNHIGLSPDLLDYHNNDLDLTIASSFANQLLTHLEEMKIFLGDFAFFKNADDFYKRMSTTSGTGENLVNDSTTNQKIQQYNEVEFEIYNPRTTGESERIRYNKNIDGSFTSLTLYEKKNYYADNAVNLTHTSPIDGEQISKMQYAYEWNMLQDFKEADDNIKAVIKKLSKEYASNYQEVNENDGQSWMNMFFFREYMIRLGAWSQAMENLFKVELKILNARSLEDIENLKVTVNGNEINVFDKEHWDNDLFESVHTLKSQYAGFSQAYIDYKNDINQSIDNAHEKVRPYTIYKTSYHVLWPSTIHGTNLSQMHYFMLKNKVDIIHMNSANKSGAIDAQAVFKSRYNDLNESQKAVADNGLNFYDDQGYFNDFVFDGEVGRQLLESSLSVANVSSLKDQVRIGNKEKTEIKGSTQSLKILLSNLIVNGEERFPGAAALVNTYKKVIEELVNRSIDKLMTEIGGNTEGQEGLRSLVTVIKRAAEDRSSPVNIIEAIEGFLHNPFIEALPNKTKIENIFYSIITNNAIAFNRPGNAFPQVAASGFEALGERRTALNNNTPTSDYIGFYDFDINENGEITKVNPADLIIPFPKEWLPDILKRARTKNIAKAINWVNDQIDQGNVVIEVKDVRIPNQQLSSNGIMKIKKFTLPTNVNFAVVPSELVVKTGGDSLLKSPL